MNAKQLHTLERRTRSLDPCPLCHRGSGDGTLAATLALLGSGFLAGAAVTVSAFMVLG